ncbi:hypothetical protein [Pontibacter burrus]|uniref:Uncharacterized protein n=1 Tax=Pontibacter burrus TaxID=2704466 RepID=A0A6B3LLX2_9BACT|nr:hypothetical protein [Pontibacter burrus]NEM96065.1 hypothetical protein [Pontibacter burrus]
MTNKRTLLAGVLTVFFFYSCSQQVAREQDSGEAEVAKTEEAIVTTEAFESDTTYNFELMPPSPDTFKLVSQSQYFYYPFGKFSTPEDLKSHYSNRFSFVDETSPLYSDGSEVITLYRLKMDKGFVKFLHTTQEDDSENNDIAIVSAKITEPSIQMINGLKVGLTRNEVREILFSKGEPHNLRSYNNITIETASTGVWVHLNFENDRLKRILVDTDYQLNKE